MAESPLIGKPLSETECAEQPVEPQQSLPNVSGVIRQMTVAVPDDPGQILQVAFCNTNEYETALRVVASLSY